jgi:phage terminase large subunit GpA-like protein
LIVDEADAMETTAEGSPIMLAEKRTLSFPDRKIIVGSTPVFEDTSHVLRSYARSDQRIFEVCCPECSGFHEVVWKDIQWPEGQPDKAAWCCPGCGVVIEERHKPAMVTSGRWRATAPEVKGHAGFRINALVSPLANASWRKLAAEFLQSKDDPATLQTFVNTILAQGWRETGEELDDSALAARAENFSLNDLPMNVLMITAGVDVQRDRLEITLIGWDSGGAAGPPHHLGAAD